jgi:transcriptional/translational regulatory protein YebC/TACO1
MFEKKGMIIFDKDKVDEEVLLDVALEAGAEDVKEEESEFEVIMLPPDFEAIKKAFDDKNIAYTVAEVSMVPQSTVKLEGKKAEQMLNLMEAFEDNDDISNVYANFDIPDEVMEAIG